MSIFNKKVDWSNKEIKVKSYEELQNECQEILNWKRCTNLNCDVDKTMVDNLLISGDDGNWTQKEDSTCSICDGFGVIQK